MESKVTLMVLGEMGVGKTCMLQRFTKGKFIAYNSGTSLNRYFKDIRFPSETVQLEIFDTGGDERFRNIVKANFKKVDGVLLVYDATDVASFHKLSAWLDDFRSVNYKAVALIAGNKCDVTDTKTVSQTMVENFAAEKSSEFYEISAKTGVNVKEIFVRLTEKVLEQKNEGQQKRQVKPPSTLLLPSNQAFSMSSENLSNQPSEPPVKQPSSTSSEDEGDWCFPDLEYLNARNRNLYEPKGDLPPVVPLPEDHVVLHVERCRTDLIRKRKTKCLDCF